LSAGRIWQCVPARTSADAAFAGRGGVTAAFGGGATGFVVAVVGAAEARGKADDEAGDDGASRLVAVGVTDGVDDGADGGVDGGVDTATSD
jgi:hypothetical protein